jgi:excisionase family DNA binding protein
MPRVLKKGSDQDARQSKQQDDLLTPEEVAEQLRVTLPTVYAWLKMGRLHGLRAGKFWRIRPADLEAFLNPSPEEIEREKASLRRYSREEIMQFLAEDQVDPETIQRIERRLGV